MARKTRKVVIAELTAWSVEFDPDGEYSDLCKLLKQAIALKVPEQAGPEGSPPPTVEPKQLTIINRIKKRNTFLGDSVRDERDSEFLNKEISQRKYKGKLLRTTRIKEYEVSADGFWETKFIIELKE